ncbi:MAG: sterol desaturase family protein [Oceanococcaceae bacterium]
MTLDAFYGLIQSAFGPHIDWKAVVLTLMTPIFLIAFATEWAVMKKRGEMRQFQLRDILTNMGLGASYSLFEFIAHALIVAAAVTFFWEHRVFSIPVNIWTVLPIFIAVEFCYYWFHRGSHRIRWFWSAHVVHHTGETMNMSTAMRQSLLYSITGWWLFFMPLVLLGVHPAVVFFMYGVDLAYQFFIHTNSIGKLHPWVEYWFDTPSNHRAHHGRNPQYIDKNYGGVLICFDRWFGTYVEEEEPVDYGIPRERQPTSGNVFVLNFHEFRDMWADVLRSGSIGERLSHLWRPPEWQRPERGPDGATSHL